MQSRRSADSAQLFELAEIVPDCICTTLHNIAAGSLGTSHFPAGKLPAFSVWFALRRYTLQITSAVCFERSARNAHGTQVSRSTHFGAN